MKLRWLGHACFQLTTNNGTKIIIDPYDENTGYGTLSVQADVLITSHSHHDHANTSSVSGYRILVDSEGDYNYRDVEIKTMKSFHDDVNGAKRGSNLLTCVEADGQRVVHLGDLGHRPDERQLKFIRGADVLLIPVGGFFTIDTNTAVDIIRKAAPKAAVPMHYKTADNDYPISTVDEFVQKTRARFLQDYEAEVSALSGCVAMDWNNLQS